MLLWDKSSKWPMRWRTTSWHFQLMMISIQLATWYIGYSTQINMAISVFRHGAGELIKLIWCRYPSVIVDIRHTNSRKFLWNIFAGYDVTILQTAQLIHIATYWPQCGNPTTRLKISNERASRRASLSWSPPSVANACQGCHKAYMIAPWLDEGCFVLSAL